jgi:hypothetical protein
MNTIHGNNSKSYFILIYFILFFLFGLFTAYLLHARTVESQKVKQARNNKTTGLCNPFLGNSSVNTIQHATTDEASFLCGPRHATI